MKKETKLNSGLYIPSDNEKYKDMHFVIVNVDFKNDTPDGKIEFQGTGMTAFQISSDEKVKTWEIKRSSKTELKFWANTHTTFSLILLWNISSILLVPSIYI